MSAEYIYGENNGGSYVDFDKVVGPGDHNLPHRTHWDPRLEIKAIAGTVQLGIIPASEKSTDDAGIWDPSDGQFLSLSRDGLIRLIRAARAARDEAYGADA